MVAISHLGSCTGRPWGRMHEYEYLAGWIECGLRICLPQGPSWQCVIELIISSKIFWRSLSLLYRVVPRPLMPSAIIGEVDIPYNLWSNPQFLLFTPDGTRILHGSTNGTIRVWDLSLRELIKIPTEHVSQAGDWARLLNDQILVSGTSKGFYNFWDVTSGMPIKFCTASRGPEGLDFRHPASAPNDLTAQRWEMILRDANRWQDDPRVHKTHNRVACIFEGSIFVDEKSSNTRIASLNVGPKPQEDFMLSPGGKSISFRLPGSNDSCLWNIDAQTVYRLNESLCNQRFYRREWSSDGHYIAIDGYSDFTLWHTHTGALVSVLNFSRVFQSQGRVCFSPDGRCFAATDGCTIKLWDMKTALLHGPYRLNHPLSLHSGVVDISHWFMYSMCTLLLVLTQCIMSWLNAGIPSTNITRVKTIS